MQIEALMGLTFARPWALLVLPVAAFCCWMLYRKVNQRSAWDTLLPPTIRKTLLLRPAGGKHAGRFLFLASGWLVGVLALAGPVLESPLPATQANQSALVIVWDVSHNMMASDLQPNRLERSRRKIRDLMQMHSDSQLALIAYAGTAHPVTPLSNDTQTLNNLLAALEPDVMPEAGQNLDAGLRLARQMIAPLPPDNSRILVITSGVEGAQLDALREHARDLGSRLSILGAGTAEGSPVPLTEGGFMRDAQGRILLPRLDSKSLAAIARTTGARYQPIRLDDQDLMILAPTAQSLADTAQDPGTSRNDQGHWLILLLLPLAAMGARRGWLGLVLCLALVPLPTEASTWQDLWQRPDQQALQLLQRQQPQAAAQRFEDPRWRAWAHYQAGEYAAAADAYAALLSTEPDNPEHHFNHGTALAMAGDFQAALEAYEQTLTRAPEHQQARHNRDRIEALLEELARQKADAEDQPTSDLGDNTDDSEPGDSAPDDNSNSDAPAPSADEQDDATAPSPPGADADSTAAAGDEAQPDGSPQDAAPDAPVQSQAAEQRGDPEVGDSSAGTRDNEQQAALRQWLQDIPDDPAELLKRKFLYQRLQQLEERSQ